MEDGRIQQYHLIACNILYKDQDHSVEEEIDEADCVDPLYLMSSMYWIIRISWIRMVSILSGLYILLSLISLFK